MRFSRVFFISIILNFYLPFAAYSGSPENGLIAYWNFHEASGEIAKDISGHGNDGHIYGAKRIPVRNGFALQFDGHKDYILINKSPLFNFGKNDFAIEMTIKPNDLTQGSTLITGGGAYGLIIRVGGEYSDKVIMFVNNWDTYRYSGAGALKLGYWNHVVFVKKGENIDCYIDGKISNGSTTVIPSSLNSLGNLNIGGSEGYGYFKGIIGEVKLYNLALTAEEIKTIYQKLPFPIYLKYANNLIKKILKYLFLAAMIAFVIYMRIVWTRDEID